MGDGALIEQERIWAWAWPGKPDCGQWSAQRPPGVFSTEHVRADLHAATLARAEHAEAANRGLVRLNEATEARAERAEALLKEAGDILDLGVELVNQDDLTDSAGWDAFDAQARAALSAIPATAPWTPPEEAERPDFFACLGWALDEWLHVVWLRGQWRWAGTYDAAVTPTHFAPLPPAPEDAP